MAGVFDESLWQSTSCALYQDEGLPYLFNSELPLLSPDSPNALPDLFWEDLGLNTPGGFTHQKPHDVSENMSLSDQDGSELTVTPGIGAWIDNFEEQTIYTDDPETHAEAAEEDQIAADMTVKSRQQIRGCEKETLLRQFEKSPYPDNDTLQGLARETGLAAGKVRIWFNNRRHRTALKDPVPQVDQASQLSPQEVSYPLTESNLQSMQEIIGTTSYPGVLAAYIDMPLEEDPAQLEAIRRQAGLSLPLELGSDPFSNSTPGFFHSADSSGSSCGSFTSQGSRRSRRGRRLYSTHVSPPLFLPNSNTDPAFFCTFCGKQLKDEFQWKRHEESVDVPRSFWICELSPCQDNKPTDDRIFKRKDQYVQHFERVHRDVALAGCKEASIQRAQREAPAIMLNHPVLKCGFCGIRLVVWKERVDHISNHFRSGLKLSSWWLDILSVDDIVPGDCDTQPNQEGYHEMESNLARIEDQLSNECNSEIRRQLFDEHYQVLCRRGEISSRSFLLGLDPLRPARATQTSTASIRYNTGYNAVITHSSVRMPGPKWSCRVLTGLSDVVYHEPEPNASLASDSLFFMRCVFCQKTFNKSDWTEALVHVVTFHKWRRCGQRTFSTEDKFQMHLNRKHAASETPFDFLNQGTPFGFLNQELIDKARFPKPADSDITGTVSSAGGKILEEHVTRHMEEWPLMRCKRRKTRMDYSDCPTPMLMNESSKHIQEVSDRLR